MPGYRRGNPVSTQRVLRGGAWINNPENARAANRNRNQPDNRNNNRDFRVVCASHTPLAFQQTGMLPRQSDLPVLVQLLSPSLGSLHQAGVGLSGLSALCG
ncbi:MAG: hypothetical protein DBP03_04865 [gamma proteobacterium symbiont of Ctena orbiculata]|nr:MAG: hypothetical protein DBP03_04865 [gamma proteobacterium symbiont of Ctena orbiculata]